MYMKPNIKNAWKAFNIVPLLLKVTRKNDLPGLSQVRPSDIRSKPSGHAHVILGTVGVSWGAGKHKWVHNPFNGVQWLVPLGCL